jgi:hypothetical protein
MQIPYLNVETEEYLTYKWSSPPDEDVTLVAKRHSRLLKHFEKFSKLGNIYGSPRDDRPPELHLPYTLDESYYVAQNIYERDCDQVINRYIKKRANTLKRPLNPCIIMIHHLWVWKIKGTQLSLQPHVYSNKHNRYGHHCFYRAVASTVCEA